VSVVVGGFVEVAAEGLDDDELHAARSPPAAVAPVDPVLHVFADQ